MARSPRIEYPNAVYHILARGNRREAIVFSDKDRQLFIDTLGGLCFKHGWEIFAWVLLDNHYHIAARTPEGNLVDGMKWFQNTFTRRINVRNRRRGRLFGDRYKSILVDAMGNSNAGAGGNYLATLVDYIHLNPARAGVADGVSTSSMDYPWCSLSKGYAIPSSKRFGWMACKEGLAMVGLEDNATGRREYIRRLDGIAAAEGKQAGLVDTNGQNLQSTLRRGWYWGSQQFKEKMLAMFGASALFHSNHDYQSSQLLRDHGTARAMELFDEACSHYKINAQELLQARRGDEKKASLAWRIWRETSVSQSWIADKLSLKTATNVSQVIRRFSQVADKDLPLNVKKWKQMSKVFD
jgi:putative transposase